MKKLIIFIIFHLLIIPFGTKANETFCRGEALTLVMEQYERNLKLKMKPNLKRKT